MEAGKARNENMKSEKMKEGRKEEERAGGRSGPCTDVDGGSGDLSNGGLAEKRCSDLHGTSCSHRGEFMHALTLYYWLSTVRVHVCARPCVQARGGTCARLYVCVCAPCVAACQPQRE